MLKTLSDSTWAVPSRTRLCCSTQHTTALTYNPWHTRLCYAARGHICKYIQYTLYNYTTMQTVKYTAYCDVPRASPPWRLWPFAKAIERPPAEGCHSAPLTFRSVSSIMLFVNCDILNTGCSISSLDASLTGILPASTNVFSRSTSSACKLKAVMWALINFARLWETDGGSTVSPRRWGGVRVVQ